MEIIGIFVLSVFAGCLIGLLPGVPLWIGPFLLLPFIGDLSLIQIMTFWIGCSVGSQFFGSVTALLLKLPGETSSMIYIADLDRLDWAQRIEVLRQSAWGSGIASLGALIIMFLVSLIDPMTIMSIGNFTVKFYIYLLMILLLIWFSDKRVVSAVLLALGVFLCEKTNQTLPLWVMQGQRMFDDITALTLLLGLMIIPEWTKTRNSLSIQIEKFQGYSKKPLEWGAMIRSTVLGGFTGLIPGPSATISSMIAYNTCRGDISRRIIAAESANNSAIITGMFPFLLFGIPIALDQLAVSSLFDIKAIQLPNAVFETFAGVTYFDWLLLITLAFTVVYCVMSQMFLNFYTSIVYQLHTRLWLLYSLVISAIIYIDVKYFAMDLSAYFFWLILAILVGLGMRKHSINPMPLILGFVLGDQITWSTYHFIKSL
jgi:putative tricarboxylic transport membrane protein